MMDMTTRENKEEGALKMSPMMGPNSDMLGKERVGSLLFKMSVPAVIAMMVQSLYNIIDGIFIGHWVGAHGLGGITAVLPIQFILMALGMLFGMGGASVISRRMGAGDQDGACLALGNMVVLCAGSGLLCLIIGLLTGDSLIRFSGASGENLSPAMEYFQIILFGTPLITFGMAGSSSARAEGNAKVAMMSMLIGAVLNIALDPVFIAVLGLGVRGAALATVVSMTLSAVYLLHFYLSGRSILSIRLRDMRLNRALDWEMMTIGFSDFVRTVAMSLTMGLMINTISHYAGEIAVAAFGVFFRVMSFLFMPMMGIAQGAQPIIGFNYGANRLDRVKKALRLANVGATSVAVFGFVILVLFPGPLFRGFSNDPELINTGKTLSRFMGIGLPVVGYQMIAISLFQALGKAGPALFLAVSRQVVFLIPMILILPRLLGLTGLWLTFPAADFVSFMATFALVTLTMRNLAPSIHQSFTE
jgi:putative MATE family efflux protein